MRKAFTMLEMIFVIVIMGIISTITFSMIAQYYESYIQKEATGQLETDTKIIVEQIAAHLQDAIKESVAVLNSGLSCDKHIALYASGQASLPGIAWVREDAEGRLGVWKNIDATTGQYMPGWSGYADLSLSDTTKMVTPGSDLQNLPTLIQDLSGQVVLPTNFAAVHFVGDGTISEACNEFITPNASMMYPIKSFSGTTIELDNVTPKLPTTIKEHYRLAWSAYALVHNRTGKNELELVYNFRPWKGDTIANVMAGNQPAQVTYIHPGKKYSENSSYVSSFAVKYESGLIRFNVCLSKLMGADFNATVCKEKVVF